MTGVRTCFDIDEQDEYRAARALLVRRCRDWAVARDRPADGTLLMSALDSRHFSSDGRLTYWTPAHVRRYLLDWLPNHLAADAVELVAAPEVLRTLLHFIDEYGLRDPRGAETADNENAIAAAVAELPDVLDDPTQSGPVEFFGHLPEAVAIAGNDDADAEVDPQAVRRALHELHTPVLREERALAQLPVHLPPAADLREAARDSVAVTRIHILMSWLGPGRDLDPDGEVTASDRAELAGLIGGGDASAQAGLYLAWARHARLIRRYRGRLVPVAKARGVLDDPFALWCRIFSELERLGDQLCPPGRAGRSLMRGVFGDVVTNILNSLYSLPEPMPMVRMEETVWQHARGAYAAKRGSARPRTGRVAVERDLNRLWQILVDLGAAQRSVGMPAKVFLEDLRDGEPGSGEPMSPFEPHVSARLMEKLSHPGPLVWLTDLATAALRDRMLAEGREAGLIGELADTGAAEMLGVVTQHYPPQSKAEEVAGWLSVHQTGIETLVDVARHTPLRSRAAAILELVCDVEPAAVKMLRRMRSDPKLAPAALMCLVETGTLDMLDLTEPERHLVTAESSLRLLEMDGPDAIINGLGELPGPDARVVLDRILASGHPDTHALDEFRELVATPLSDAVAPPRPQPPPRPPMERLGSTRRARLRRRQAG